MKINIGVIFGGQSGEYEVSLQSATAIVGELDHERYQIWPIAIAKDGTWYGPVDEQAVADFKPELYKNHEVVLLPKPGGWLVAAESGQLIVKLDVAFSIIHGTTGEDGVIQGLFELADLPYVGAGVTGSAVGMDKIMMRKILAYHHIPQVRFTTVLRSALEKEPEQVMTAIEAALPYPMFVKPANAGSSVGVSKVSERSDLLSALQAAAQYDRKVLIEEGINAREIEVAVLGNDLPEASVPGEIIASNAFYDYKAKYIDNKSTSIIPAEVTEEQKAAILALALQAYSAMDCAGLARVDFFISKDDGSIYLNEINTLPGFTKISMYAKLWAASGLPMPQLLDRLVDLAFAKFEDRQKNNINLSL